MNCPVEVLIQRDVKGLYKKALAGEIKQFTGISDPYESPIAPELTIDSSTETVESSVERILRHLQELNVVSATAVDLQGSQKAVKSMSRFG